MLRHLESLYTAHYTENYTAHYTAHYTSHYTTLNAGHYTMHTAHCYTQHTKICSLRTNLLIYQARVWTGPSRVSDSQVSEETVIYEAPVFIGEIGEGFS